jgi:hypothetical protein
MATQRIDLPAAFAKAAPSPDGPATLLLKLVAGTFVLLLGAALILPYLAVMAGYMVAAAGLHQVKVAGTAVYETLIYAGSFVTGR